MVASSEIRVTGEDALDGKEKGTLELEVTAMVASVCNGDYTLRITVYAGTAEQTKNTTFSVAGATNCEGTPLSAAVTKTLGAQGATAGSALDIDGGNVWSSGDANTNAADIDLVYGIYQSKSMLMNASQAVANDFYPGMTGAGSAEIYEVSGTMDDYTTTADIAAAIDGLTSVTQVEATVGTVIVVETTDGIMAVVSVDDVDAGSTSGTVTVKYAK
jgi:hypothetical protein